MLDYDKGIVTKTKIIFSIGIFSDSNNPIFLLLLKILCNLRMRAFTEENLK